MAPWQIQSIPCMCITLERRKDRWKRFQDQPGLQGLDVKRFIGVDGKTLDYMNDPRISTMTKRTIKLHQKRSHSDIDTVGGVGCAMSHAAVWKWMVETQQEACLVFEDDALVPPDFIQQANKMISESAILPNFKKWNMWLIGGKWEEQTPLTEESPTSPLSSISSFLCIHAYVITLPTAQQFLDHVFPIECQVDTWMSVYCYLHKLRILGSKTFQIYQNGVVKTDIQNKEECIICDVPTNFDKTKSMISYWDLYLARASEATLIGLCAYYAYQRWYKR